MPWEKKMGFRVDLGSLEALLGDFEPFLGGISGGSSRFSFEIRMHLWECSLVLGWQSHFLRGSSLFLGEFNLIFGSSASFLGVTPISWGGFSPFLFFGNQPHFWELSSTLRYHLPFLGGSSLFFWESAPFWGVWPHFAGFSPIFLGIQPHFGAVTPIFEVFNPIFLGTVPFFWDPAPFQAHLTDLLGEEQEVGQAQGVLGQEFPEASERDVLHDQLHHLVPWKKTLGNVGTTLRTPKFLPGRRFPTKKCGNWGF